MRHRGIEAIIVAALIAAAALAHSMEARAAAGGQPVNQARDGLALKGYDPVAYFDGNPVAGSPAFEYVWNGARYRFASAANRDRFTNEPVRFAPQYGGFCAYAVSRGYTADIDPLSWAVVENRLYLNYSKRAQRLWQEDVPGNIQKGDANWPKLRDRK